MKIKFEILLLILLAGINVGQAANLVEISGDQMKEIDTQVQDVKYDAVEIATAIAKLEEKLNFPASTQISIFLSLTKGEQFFLEEVDLKIDGKQAISHAYTSKEIYALQHGGVQRLFTGNILAGVHTLEVSTVGQSSNNKGYRQNANFKFSKKDSAELIEVTLAGPGYGNQGVIFRNPE